MTSYVVLHRYPTKDESGPITWTEIVVVNDVSSADAAIRQVAAENASNGMFVAIPARSWNPRKVNIVEVTKVDFA